MKIFHLLLCTLLFASTLQAQEVRYIRDTLHVPLRSGESTRHRIVHKGLVSGTQVRVLESNPESGYSRVVTSGGIEGWIQDQYLVSQPVAKDLLERAQQQLASLKGENRKLQESLDKLRSQNSGLSSSTSELEQQNAELQNRLDEVMRVSSNALRLDEDNRTLIKKNQQLENELNVLSTDHQRLQDSHDNEAFLNGALAVLIGVMITLLVPRFWPKKRSEWA